MQMGDGIVLPWPLGLRPTLISHWPSQCRWMMVLSYCDHLLKTNTHFTLAIPMQIGDGVVLPWPLGLRPTPISHWPSQCRWMMVLSYRDHLLKTNTHFTLAIPMQMGDGIVLPWPLGLRPIPISHWPSQCRWVMVLSYRGHLAKDQHSFHTGHPNADG